MYIKTTIYILLCAFSAASLAHPCEATQTEPTQTAGVASATMPARMPNRKQVLPVDTTPPTRSAPDISRYASLADMAADPKIRRLFSPWIGKGSMYVNSDRKYMKDLTNSRRNSYTGLQKRGFVNCQIGQHGKSRFVGFGQADVLYTSWWGREVANSHGGVWPSSGDVSPEQQGKYESYCELFHQLAPHFIDQGQLEP